MLIVQAIVELTQQSDLALRTRIAKYKSIEAHIVFFGFMYIILDLLLNPNVGTIMLPIYIGCFCLQIANIYYDRAYYRRLEREL